jgi:DNA primase
MSLKSFILQCHNTLVNEQDQEVLIAQDYLKSRNVLDKTIKSVIIGYCKSDEVIPDPVRFFGEELRKEDEKWDLSYYLRGRIIIPVFSEFGSVVGIATRKPTKEPGNTWWNLPAPFRKGSHLFLLNTNKKNIFKKNKIYLVEGYMDAIILKQFGLDNVVSLMGTALTTRKIGLIARYCNNVCLCFDVDKNEAGQKARDISIAILKKFDFCENISVIHDLPVGTDPDEFVAQNGLDEFLKKEVVLKDSDIEKICRKIAKQKNSKEVLHAL